MIFDMSFLFVYIVRIKFYSKKGKEVRVENKKLVLKIIKSHQIDNKVMLRF